MKDAFNEGLPYVTHFVVFHPFHPLHLSSVFHFLIKNKPMLTMFKGCFKQMFNEPLFNIYPIKPEDGGGGAGGVIFAHSKFKFKLFLNGLWYEPENL